MRRNSMTICAASTVLSEKAMNFMTGNSNDVVPQSELDRYGIERVPADAFLWGGYRYSNARDALAAAKRNAK
jgi:hypothetical protein